MKAYLLALEINPVEVGKVYTGLPLHCTLAHWFWVDELSDLLIQIQSLVQSREAPKLLIQNEEQFTGVTKDGPIAVRVNKVKKTPDVISLHEDVASLLEENGVTYSMPQYIHNGYVPHVTHQESSRVHEGDMVLIRSLYLADADAPEYGNERQIIHKFSFKHDLNVDAA